MKFAWYLNLFNYLLDGSYPDGASKVVKQKIRRHAVGLIIRGEALIEQDSEKEVLHEANVRKIIIQVHEEGHFSGAQLYKHVKNKFTYDKDLLTICNLIAKECITCQMRARPVVTRRNFSRPIPTPAFPFHLVGVDAVGPLEITQKGNRYILTGIDYLTRWPVALAVPNIDETTTVSFYYSCIVQNHGVPKYILSDRGKNFISNYTKSFLHQLGCRSIATTSFRAQCNGMVERLNQSLCRTIAKLARDKNDLHEWDNYLEPALLALRTLENASTEFSPSELLYGYQITTPGLWSAPLTEADEETMEELLVERVKFIRNELAEIRLSARENSEQAKGKQAERYNKRVKALRVYEIGEQVLLKENVPKGKFGDKWSGPYVVLKRKGVDNYYLEGPRRARVKAAVNSDFLKPYIERKTMEPDIEVKHNHEHFKTWVYSGGASVKNRSQVLGGSLSLGVTVSE